MGAICSKNVDKTKVTNFEEKQQRSESENHSNVTQKNPEKAIIIHNEEKKEISKEDFLANNEKEKEKKANEKLEIREDLKQELIAPPDIKKEPEKQILPDIETRRNEPDLEKREENKGYLTHNIPKTVLKNLGGGMILTIKETGEVINGRNITIGFFHDHWKYKSRNATQGSFSNDKDVLGHNNNYIGNIDSGGMIFDKHGKHIGKIEETGSFRNEIMVPVAKCEGEIKRMALLFYFFHPEFQKPIY